MMSEAQSNLNGDHSLCRINAKHGEQIHHWVCAPADHRHDLCRSDLALDNWVWLGLSGSCKAHKQLMHNVQEESHGQEPARPARSEVTSNTELTIVSRHDHECRANTKIASLRVVGVFIMLHHQEDPH